jgi:hypothetical protein
MKLFAWQKHTIFIVLTFILGFIFFYYLKILNLISTETQITYNLLLNMLAMAYALYMFRLYDIAKEKTLSSIFGKCIQKGYDDLKESEKSQFQKNIESFGGFISVVIDKISRISEKEFGMILGKMIPTLEVKPKEIEDRISLVSGKPERIEFVKRIENESD